MKLEVAYFWRCSEWHPKSSPYIRTVEGNNIVCRMSQWVDHPGMYDEQADKMAHAMVDAFNNWEGGPEG